MFPERWFWIEVNVPAMNTRLPTTSMFQISPLLIFGMSTRAFSGTTAVCPGAGLVPGVSGVTVPGLTTTEKRWVFATARLDRATRAAAVPVATGPLESVISELILFVPVDAAARRVVALVGLVQVCAREDRSDQELTSQEPDCATATVGELWLVAVVVEPAVSADAVTEGLLPVLR